MSLYKRLPYLALAIGLTFSAAPHHASAATVTVEVDGQVVPFDQPPIQNAGRVFVPLRGVFERLGASVVYANGQINAQGNGRSIGLHIGSTAAVVNGSTVYMDVAPFIIGARTLVPLRFIAQSLGAAVNWSQSNQTVYINSESGGANVPPPAASFSLTQVNPENAARSNRPAIWATFSEPVNPNSIRILLDGRDVSSLSYMSRTRFDFTPSYALPPARHTVDVTGQTESGIGFDKGWTFTTGSMGGNFVNGISPLPGSQVRNAFTLSGRTLPNSRVTIVATSQATAFGIIPITTGTFKTQTYADSNGYFSADVNMNALGGGQVHVIIQSIAPDQALGSAEATVVYST
ncbi:MAG TPA: copper amine oxidase N-terminal domain-containing protein [Candidatus Dormibacteraeota bacterium]|nr:copper amine oxidase N-terminal domain-containing protein [Candidatus Dormibacteraeota bacterium]